MIFRVGGLDLGGAVAAFLLRGRSRIVVGGFPLLRFGHEIPPPDATRHTLRRGGI